ncbi:putative S-layer protein [Xenococcus sp. PCC 7305]|uniref:S-layer homology domain-containing protein n=1 Tax=Xenococcus sp. PCC 7305 TaxID=102125 RepID=UPI0002ABB4E2|nr:S-layer homology domain-containing protein [Xenococcus sp. PCC 7305]ELS03023.1 putative S-layer protein [Xenococcus sp. PCC 7305]
MKFLSGISVAAIATTALAFYTLPNRAQDAATFSDIEGNVYAAEIEEGAKLGIVTGFPDGTYRPNDTVSKEEAVSMIIDAIDKNVTPVDLDEAPTRATSAQQFTDVPEDRWSAKKIAWAQWNFLPAAGAANYSGEFRPEEPISRIDLIDFLRRSAGISKARRKESTTLTPTQDPITFSDVAGYDLEATMTMSAYCGVASPLNEEGDAFAPEQPANRDYAVAAIVRTVKCIENDPN